MIITCPNCNKQFMINNSMIPDEGRDLQCGSCNHVWFYKIEKQNNEVLKLDEEIESQDIDEKVQSLENVKTEIKNELKEKKSEKLKNNTTSKKTEKKLLLNLSFTNLKK